MSSEDKKTGRLNIAEWIPYSPLGFLVVFIFSSVVNVLEVISKGAESLEAIGQSILSVTILLWLATIITATVILVVAHKNPPKIGTEIALADKSGNQKGQQQIEDLAFKKLVRPAKISLWVALALAFILGLGLGIFLWCKAGRENQAIAALSVPSDKFGIVVVQFAEGPDLEPSIKGQEVTKLFILSLGEDLQRTSLADKVVIREWPEVIRTESDAQRVGKILSAKIVIWGWIPVGTQNAFVPTFSLISSGTSEPVMPTPGFIGTPVSGLETIQMSELLSEKTAALVAFISGISLLQNNDPASAISKFDEAIKILEEAEKLQNDPHTLQEYNETLALIYTYRGIAKSRMQQYDGAKFDFMMAIQLRADAPEPLIAMGNLYYSQGEWQTAQEWYSQALTLQPSNWVTHYSLGNVYLSMGEANEAVNEYQQAIEINPASALAHFNLALSYESLGNYTDAISEYKSVISLVPDEPIAAQAKLHIENIQKTTGTPSIAGTVQPINTPGLTPLPTQDPLIALLDMLGQHIPGGAWTIMSVLLAVMASFLERLYSNTGGPRGVIVFRDYEGRVIKEFILSPNKRVNVIKWKDFERDITEIKRISLRRMPEKSQRMPEETRIESVLLRLVPYGASTFSLTLEDGSREIISENGITAEYHREL